MEKIQILECYIVQQRSQTRVLIPMSDGSVRITSETGEFVQLVWIVDEQHSFLCERPFSQN